MNWQLQDAKAQFSRVVGLAKISPQIVTVRGKEEVVVISKKRYDALTRKKTGLVEFFQASPLQGLNLTITRDQSPPRDMTF